MANPIKSFKSSLGRTPKKYRFWASLGVLAALLIALPVTLIGLMTGTFELRKMATGEVTPIPTSISRLAGCQESCGNDQDCQEGLLCGSPCPPGQACIEELFCYNPTCPYDRDCICGGTPTPIACVEECEIAMVYLDAPDCCPGLEGRTRFQIDDEGNCQPLFGGVICLGGCGDGQCLSCENYCNCPEDCIPTLTLTPTVPTSINLKIKFDGVTSRPIDDSDREIQIYATNLSGGPDLGSADNKETVRVTVDDLGVYHGQITFSSDHFGHRYRLRIKGPKHLQRVFPDEVFLQELDLTDWPLKPGDLDQDGDVDINDLQAVKVFSTDPADISLGDVNYDGRLSVLDRVLILNTLSVQYDPN